MIFALVVLIAAICVSAQASLQQVTITAYYPRKVQLSLRGSDCGLNWDKGVAMSVKSFSTQLRGAANSSALAYEYSYTVSCQLPVETPLEVKVLVNDQTWMIGSNHHIPLTAQTKASALYPWFYTYKGSTQIVSRVYSPQLKNYRDVIVYTPPSYNENTLKTHRNVLVMHDGQNLFDPRTSAFGTAWMAQDTVDGLVSSGGMDEVVIIGPYNTPDRMDEYTYIYDPSEKAGGKGDLYLDFIQDTLLPAMTSQFRIELHRDTLGILGSSLGGLISCYGGWTRSTVYGKVGCMSSSFWWDDNDYQKNVITSSFPSTPLPAVYMDSGTSGGELSCAEYTTQIFNYMTGKGFVDGVNVKEFIAQGGQHNEASWAARFYVPMQFLYPPTTA